MRIAMIHTPFQTRAGGERQILKLSIELQKKGHEVEIFTNWVNWSTFPEFFDKVKINVVPFEEKAYYGPFTPVFHKYAAIFSQDYRVFLPQMLKIGFKISKNFDIINNHNFPTEWAGYIAKARLKVPLVWMCNEPPYWFLYPQKRKHWQSINWPLYEVFDKETVKYIDDIMVLSHVSEGYVKKVYNRPSKIVRTGVDVQLIHEASGKNLRQKLGLENSFVMLFIGGSVYAKRTDAVKTLALLSKKYDNIKLIIDSPIEHALLRNLSKLLGVENKLFLLNSKSDKELAEVYAASDVFIYPSTVSTWGLVVIEAMAASKPVIVPQEVGASEVIENGENGIIVDVASPEKIAAQVERLYNNSKLYSKIADNAYRYVRDNLSWEKYAENVERVFEDALKR
jgi:glycosyltransferase involved in cell wall biosynthesis